MINEMHQISTSPISQCYEILQTKVHITMQSSTRGECASTVFAMSSSKDTSESQSIQTRKC